MDWRPDPGETAIYRSPISFPSGLAPAVSECRWFRDTERNDIQQELLGWPPGPQFSPRTKAGQAAQRAGRGIAVGVPLIGNLVSNVLGVFGSPFGDTNLRGTPQDPENEVDDFPVMWAAPGTLARSAPWQLDPSRRPKSYRTFAVVTESRLVFVGGEKNSDRPEELLWAVPRQALVRTEHMTYSYQEADLKLTFQDGSWLRLCTLPHGKDARFVGLLAGTHRPLGMAELAEPQRRRVEEFAASLPPGSSPLSLMLLPSGLVHATSESPTDRGRTIHQLVMDQSGRDGRFQPGDLR